LLCSPQIQEIDLAMNVGVHDVLMGSALTTEFIVAMFPHVPQYVP